MADATADHDWHLVVSHPANEIREEKEIEEWENSKGHWSGIGKHLTNWTDHKKLHVSPERGTLGVGSYGTVERITYRTVTMARKLVKPRGGMTVEQLQEEANAMERLTHKHVLKLVGTYTLKRNSLYILLYPVAVCDLSRFLEDIDDIRSGTYADREDAFKRIRLLGLKDIGTIEDLAAVRSPQQVAAGIPPAAPRSSTAVWFLQQMLGCITEALAFVHEKGIRHRDLKPKNILLSPGRVYLADFGIARDVRESEDSITSHRGGTPSWMAPEVHEEQDYHMSPADIYSLGCIFLNIATVLYGESLEHHDRVMKERDWKKKFDKLPQFLQSLRSKAKAATFHDEEQPNFNAKHIMNLVEKMLSCNPDERPTAVDVSAKLSDLGGLDQIYHLSCCHKRGTYISEVINNKLKCIHDVNAQAVARVAQLEADKAKNQERIRYLESCQGTWEQRLQNERDHAGKQYRALLEKYNKEMEARKLAEDKLKSTDFSRNRRPRSQNRGRGKTQGFMHSKAIVRVTANGEQIVPESPAVLLQRRQSQLPVPVRPSTPIRPPVTREPGSTSSTLVSSTHSLFSRSSTKGNDSASSVASSTIRSSPPGSPTTAVPASPKMEKPSFSAVAMQAKPNEKEEGKRPAHGAKPSWANLVAKAASKG